MGMPPTMALCIIFSTGCYTRLAQHDEDEGLAARARNASANDAAAPAQPSAGRAPNTVGGRSCDGAKIGLSVARP